MADLKMMKALDVGAKEIRMEGVEGATVRWLISTT